MAGASFVPRAQGEKDFPIPEGERVVVLAAPRGFCAGVRRAIQIVELALEGRGPVFVRHQIVHNQTVVEGLERRGAIFVEELDEVPDGATVIFSAHGVPKRVLQQARHRKLPAIDATCPLVARVHREAIDHSAQGRHVILIGHAGHPEVVGTMGQLPTGATTLVQSSTEVADLPISNPEVAFVTQTTLSKSETAGIIAALRARWPDIAGPAGDHICFATTNRQEAVLALSGICETIVVVGSPNSSNSTRLREVAEQAGVTAQLVEDEQAIDWAAIQHCARVGITAGASAPEDIVQRVASRVAVFIGAERIVEMTGPDEPHTFALPRRLFDDAA